MAKPIIWQNKAVDQFENIQEYLLSEWGESVVTSFTQQVFQVLELLSRYPKIGPMEVPERNIRGYVVNKQITILYQVEPEAIHILALFDNRQYPADKSNEL